MKLIGKKTTVLILAAVLLLSGGFLRGQVIVVKNNDLQLPVMFENEVITNNFIVSNASDQSVEVTGVRPTCGCTFARAETDVIPPHGLTRIIFGYHANSQPGSVSKKILLSAGTNQVYLGFTATVRSIFSFDRYNVEFRNVDRTNAKVLSAEVVVTPSDSCADVAVDSLNCSSTNVKAVWTWDKKTRLVNFKVTVDTAKYAGNNIRENVGFNMTCGGISRQFNIPVFVTFK